MKRIIILLLTICSFVSYGQILQDPNTTPSTSRTNDAISGSYTVSGTNAYSISPLGDFSYTYLTGKAVSITIPVAQVNTTSSTLNFDGLGVKNIKKWSSGSLTDVSAGDLIGTVRLRYDGTQFVMEGGTGSGSSASGTNNELPPVTKTASFTLSASDTSKMIILDAASDLIITLPDFSAIDKGMQFALFRKQADSVYFAAGGQTYNSSSGDLGGVAVNSFLYVYYDYVNNEFDISNGSVGGGGTGSGTVNSGTQYRIAHYATTGTAVSEAAAITASRALVSNSNGVPTHAITTATEIGYVNGVTSAIQTQIDTKAATNVKTDVAYVETTGNDGTGVLGRSDKPFLTITGALAAGVGSAKLVIKIGLGDFSVPLDDSGIDGTSVLRNNVTYEGTKMPETDATFTIGTFPAYPTMSSPTKLQNGTVLKGRFSHVNRKNIIIRNLGVDVGSAFCTATGGSYVSGANGIGFADTNSGGGSGATGMNTGIRVENVVILGQSSTSAYHCLVMENCLEPVVRNVYTFFNTHGFVSKNQGGIYDGIHTHGHGTDGIIIKSNVYAGQQKEVLNNFQIRPIASGDTGGLIIEAANADLTDLVVSNGIIYQADFGVIVRGTDDLDRVDIENVQAISNTADGFKTDGANVKKVNFINCTASYNGGEGFNITTGDGVTLVSPRAYNNTSDGISSTASNIIASDIISNSNGGYGLNVGSGLFYRLSRYYRSNVLGGENGSVLNNNSSGQGATYEDTFTRANSSSSLGNLESPVTAWVVPSGTFGITSNQAYNSSARSSVSEHAVVDVGVTEGSIEIYLTPDNTNAHCSVVFRYLDANNFMTCNFVRTAGGDIGTALYKNVAGSFTFITGTTVNPLWSGTSQHKINISWSGTTVSLSVDDVAKYSNVSMGTTGLEANTKVGFGQYIDASAGDDGGTLYDNFTFTALGGGSQNEGVVADAIVDGIVDIAPSQNAVYDALVLKQPRATTASGTTTGTFTTTLTDISAFTITPTGDCTFNASGGASGQICSFVVTTSGTTSWNLTFGTNFKSTGVLATGTVSAKVFTITFVYNGTNWNEIGRTTAM